MTANEFQITGRLTSQPNIRYSNSGMACATLHLELYEKPEYRKADQPRPVVDIQFFGPNAEAVQHFAPRTVLFASGYIKIDQWQYKTEWKKKIVLNGRWAVLVPIDGRTAAPGPPPDLHPKLEPAPPATAPSEPALQDDDDMDDIPF